LSLRELAGAQLSRLDERHRRGTVAGRVTPSPAEPAVTAALEVSSPSDSGAARLDGAMGTMIQTVRAVRGRLPRASGSPTGAPGRPAGQQRPAQRSPSRDIREIHEAYLEAGATSSRDQHLQRPADLAGRLRHEELAYELNVAAAALAREATRRRPAPRTAPRFVAGRSGRRTAPRPSPPTSTTPGPATSPSTSSSRPISSRPRPRRRRCRRAPRRDDLRHPQRQGGDLRPRDPVRGARAALAGDHLRHHHRRVRAHPLRPGHRGVLELRAPRPPAGHRLNCALGADQMRPYVAELARIADTFVSATPTPACPTPSGSTTRHPRQMAASSVSSRRRPGQHRRRLLRHHARTTSRRSPTGVARRPARPPDVPRPCACPGSSRASSTRTACSSTSVSAPTSPGRRGSARLIKAEDYPPRSRSPASRSRPAPRSSTSTWTRA
jgi:5-methyltetrahydrofolate--homocysteine methyltransferase